MREPGHFEEDTGAQDPESRARGKLVLAHKAKDNQATYAAVVRDSFATGGKVLCTTIAFSPPKRQERAAHSTHIARRATLFCHTCIPMHHANTFGIRNLALRPTSGLISG